MLTLALAHTGTVVPHTTLAKTGKRTMLVPLTTIAVIVGVASGFAYGEADRAMTMLQSLLSGNRFSAADIDMLRILSAAFTPSIIGLVLCLVSRWLPDDGYVSSKPCDDQRDERQPAQDGQVDWRRAA